MGFCARQLNAGRRGDAWRNLAILLSSPQAPTVVLLQELGRGSLPLGTIFTDQIVQKPRAGIYVNQDFAKSSGCHLLTEFTDGDMAQDQD